MSALASNGSRSSADSLYWRNHLARLEKSGLGVMEYCRRNKLEYHRLKYWRDKLTKRPSGFIPVHPASDPKTGDRYCTVEFSGGSRMIFESVESLQLLPWVVERLS